MNQDNTQTVDNNLPLTLTLAERTFGKVTNVTESRTGVLTRKMPPAKKWKAFYIRQNPGATASQARKAYNEELLMMAKDNATLMNAKVASGELVATRTSFNPKSGGWSTSYVSTARLIEKIERAEGTSQKKIIEDAKKMLVGVKIEDERVLNALKILSLV